MGSMAEAAIRFGVGSLLNIARRISRTDPELLKDMIEDANEVLSYLPPLSLNTQDKTLNFAIERISKFFG